MTISQFRKNLFQLVERAGKGQAVQFAYKGVRYCLVPETAPMDKLDRITPLAADLFDGTPEELLEASRKMSEEIMADWEKKLVDK